MGANFPQCVLRLAETVQLAEDQRLSLVSSGAAGFLTQEAVILGDGVPLDTFDAPAYATAEANSRSLASAFLTSFGNVMGPIFTELSKSIGVSGSGVPATAPSSVIGLLYLFMAQNQNSSAFQSQPLVYSRGLTRGTASYGASNVGTGILYRLNVDPYGFSLEGGFAQTINFTCTSDVQLGTLPGQEVFSALGQPFRDALSWYSSGFGSGLVASGNNGLVGITADTTQGLIQNSSFSKFAGTGATSSFVLTNWTQTSGLAASMSIDTTNYYRASQQEGTTPGSLKVTASVTITQLISTNSAALSIAAFMNQIAYNASIGTGVGAFTVQVGSKSWSHTFTGDVGWLTIRPTLDKNLWFQNFNVASLAVTLTITVTSGYLLLDDFCWAPFSSLDGSLYWLIGGQTGFLFNDTIKVVDSEPNPPKKVQNWIRLMFGGLFLPSLVLPAAPTTACTTALSATAGAVTAGAHVVWITFVNATGESAIGPVSLIVVADGSHKIDLASIPTGPGGTTKRGLYFSHANDVGTAATPYFSEYIVDNVTTSGAYGVADASLTKFPGTFIEPVN